MVGTNCGGLAPELKKECMKKLKAGKKDYVMVGTNCGGLAPKAREQCLKELAAKSKPVMVGADCGGLAPTERAECLKKLEAKKNGIINGIFMFKASDADNKKKGSALISLLSVLGLLSISMLN